MNDEKTDLLIVIDKWSTLAADLKKQLIESESKYEEAVEFIHQLVEHFTNNEMDKVSHLIKTEYFVNEEV